MRKGAVKAIVLIIIFIVGLVVFSAMTNHVNEDLTTEMEEATLPVITLFRDETEINELHGYRTEMNAAYMRDTITPIGEDRKLPITIQSYQTTVDAVSYEIRSLDGTRLIANADVNSYEDNKGIISAELEIQNLLKEDEEYLLIIMLESGNEQIYYYTRLVEAPESHVEESIAFVKDFNNKTFNSETVGTLSTYMEKTTGDNSTLQFVSLNSSLKQVSWANLPVERLTAPVPSIKEITDTYNVIVLNYVVTSTGESGENEYYNVEEYYRIRYTSSRMYLLNFERTTNQIFRRESAAFYDNDIQLGIRSSDVEYRANEAGTMVAFVQEGELWSYNETENTLAKVFSFRGYEGIDERENYGEHDIKIVSIDETGSLDYIVYGYMNRGLHEGEVGIAVYHYDSLANTNEEMIFIPSDKSYEVMKSEMGQLMYVNEGGELYLMMDGTVYGIDLSTLEVRKLIEGLENKIFAVSASNRFFAWTQDGENSEIVHVMDFADETTREVTEGGGKYVKPLGFMEEDFVYGVADAADVSTEAAGNIIVPMYQVKIADVASDTIEILKTYEKSGYYVSDVEIDDYTMYLNRIQYNGTAYVEADQDMIMNREGDGAAPVEVRSSSSDIKQTQYQLSLANPVSEKEPRLLTPKETILTEERNVALTQDGTGERYYVYVKGDVIFTTDDVTAAIGRANENMGVVIDAGQKYVWKRSRNATQPAFSDIAVGEEDMDSGSIAKCINAMLEKEGINISVNALIAGGETPKTILGNMMRDAQILDLSGCNVEEVLYYVSCGSPVFAMTGSEEAVLLVGYDADNVIVYDSDTGTNQRISLEEADEVFSGAGNVFLTYLK